MPNIPFSISVDMSQPAPEVPALEGYLIEVHGLYLSLTPQTVGTAQFQVSGLQGVVDGASEIVINVTSSATETVNLSIPLKGRTVGANPVSFNPGSFPLACNTTVWGEYVPIVQ